MRTAMAKVSYASTFNNDLGVIWLRIYIKGTSPYGAPIKYSMVFVLIFSGDGKSEVSLLLLMFYESSHGNRCI